MHQEAHLSERSFTIGGHESFFFGPIPRIPWSWPSRMVALPTQRTRRDPSPLTGRRASQQEGEPSVTGRRHDPSPQPGYGGSLQALCPSVDDECDCIVIETIIPYNICVHPWR